MAVKGGPVQRGDGSPYRVRLELLRLVAGSSRPLALVSLALIVIGSVLPVAFVAASASVVGAVPPAVRDGLSSPAGSSLVWRLALVAVLFVLSQALGGYRQAVFGAVGRRVDGRLRRRVMRATLGAAGVAHLEEPELRDKVALARGVGPDQVTPGLAATGLLIMLATRLGGVGFFVIVASFRWWLAIAIVVASAYHRRVLRRHLLRTIEVATGQSHALRRANYFSDLALTPLAAKETRIFGLGAWVNDRFRDSWMGAMEQVWRERGQDRLRVLWPTAVTTVLQAALVALAGRAFVRREVDLDGLMRITGAATGLQGSLLSISNEDIQLEYGSAALPAVNQLEATLATPRLRMAGSAPADGLPRSAVRFEGVCFRYPQGDREVYRGLDLEIRAGESLAIVGANGAGKTTLIKLLARLYDPTDGRIVVDGTDLRELDPVAWQRRVAAIFQDFTRYELTARDNVAFGALGLQHDDDALRRAAERAGALELVEGLPDGWDTVLSRQLAGGTDVSGGQWQRIALARALLAVEAGAGILVLDEPTANLDVRAEAEVYDRFLELTRGVTTVVISHRFSTVRRASRIVVLEGGRVVEDGDHESLVAGGGHYARMFDLQAARFAEDGSRG